MNKKIFGALCAILLLAGCASSSQMTQDAAGMQLAHPKAIHTVSVSIGKVAAVNEKVVSPPLAALLGKHRIPLWKSSKVLGQDEESQITRDFAEKFQSDLAAHGVVLASSGSGEVTMDVLVHYYSDMWGTVPARQLQVRIILKEHGQTVRTLDAEMGGSVLRPESNYIADVSENLVRQVKENISFTP